MMPQHHPSDELLFDYASGSLAEPVALIVATHMALCCGCRRRVNFYETIGGAMLDLAEPEPMSENAWAALQSRLDEPTPSPRRAAAPAAVPMIRSSVILPQPLRSYVGGELSALAWRPVMPGITEAELPIGQDLLDRGRLERGNQDRGKQDRGLMRTRLVRIKASAAVPRHTHDGMELNLVLAGGFTDTIGHFQRGDVAIGDGAVDHRPVADRGEDCLCLTVTDAPLRLTGRIGRFLNAFVRF